MFTNAITRLEEALPFQTALATERPRLRGGWKIAMIANMKKNEKRKRA